MKKLFLPIAIVAMGIFASCSQKETVKNESNDSCKAAID